VPVDGPVNREDEGQKQQEFDGVEEHRLRGG
jgi:hypothetical protein